MRFQLKMEVIVEYDVDPTHYPGTTSPEEMLAVDIKNMEDEPTFMLAIGDEKNDSIKVTGKVLDG